MKHLIIILLIFAFGCNKAKEQSTSAMADETAEEASLVNQESAIGSSKQEETKPIERLLVKKGAVEFQTDNLADISLKINTSAQKYNAYISEENEYKTSDRLSRNVVVRMPSRYFDVFLADISKGVDYFDTKTIDVSDVTEQYLDVQARLKTKKELETRYLQLLSKANKVSEILEIEREIGTLRSDIESMEGQLNYLKDQVSMSTLTITYYTSIGEDSRFWSKLKSGFANGWDFLISFILGIINIWPIWIIGFGLFWIIRKMRRAKAKA